MQEKLNAIRALLDELEFNFDVANATAPHQAISGLELPELLQEVVDFLQPELKPYEFAFYVWLFRHSIVEHGSQTVTVPGRRKLQNGIIKSTSVADGESQLSYGTGQKAFDRLIELGAISQQGEPSRNGTPFKVCLPEEIEVCIARKHEATERRNLPSPDEAQIDFYNVRENRLKVFERDLYQCKYCGKQLTRFTATLDHVHPMSEGGDNSLENLVTACLHCNSQKNSNELSSFLAKRASNPG